MVDELTTYWTTAERLSLRLTRRRLGVIIFNFELSFRMLVYSYEFFILKAGVCHDFNTEFIINDSKKPPKKFASCRHINNMVASASGLTLRLGMECKKHLKFINFCYFVLF